MPSYNHEKYISEAIESVLNQTFADFELIITDDASVDRSKEIIQAYAKKDDRIRAYYHNENKGIAKTMNDGLEAAKGKFIALFSSDDVWVENKLEKQLQVLSETEDLVVWSEGLVIDASRVPTGELFTKKHGALDRRKSGNIFNELLKGNYICGQSVILKRENVKDIKFDEQLKYLNDYKFMVELARRYEFYFIQEPLAMYRIHGKNSTLSNKDEWLKDQIVINEYFLQQYASIMPKDVKNIILLRLSALYLRAGEKIRAKRCIYDAVRCNPCSTSNLLYLINLITYDNKFIYNFLKSSYNKYKGI
jgi:glycosyltransferase involved in cell wall biosynthesis